MFALLRILVVLLSAGSIFLTGRALAEDRILPIGATAYPPFEYASRDGQTIGADTELIEQVLKRMGYVSEIRLQPWTRVESAGRRGDLAAIYSALKTTEREDYFYFSDPISASTTVFFKRKENALQWKSFDELKAMRVATCAGSPRRVVNWMVKSWTKPRRRRLASSAASSPRASVVAVAASPSPAAAG